ncbi:MAG: thioredoxin family protein [Patescibacteria group bacterium]
MKALLLLLVAVAFPAFAWMPEDFKPIMIERSGGLTENIFDLDHAIKVAQEKKKLIFIYISANDCSWCARYEEFLKTNKEAMKEIFAPYVVANLFVNTRGGAKPTFRIGGQIYNANGFRALVGDKAGLCYYPCFWALTPDLKQVRQQPRGATYYMTVEGHAKLLQSEKDVLAAQK